MADIQFLEIWLSDGTSATLEQEKNSILTPRETSFLNQIVKRLNKRMNRVRITEPKQM